MRPYNKVMDQRPPFHIEPLRSVWDRPSSSEAAGRTIVLGGFGYGVGPDGRGVDLERRGDSLSETLRADYPELD